MPDIMDVDTEPTKPAQTPAPQTEPTGWMTPDGEIRDGAPDKIRGILEKKKWNNINQLVDGYVNLEKLHGSGKHLAIPETEDAEGWNAVYDAIGRPQDPDAYELQYSGEIPVDDELVGSFKKFAHGLGLTKKQFNELVNFQLDAVGLQEQAYKTQQSQQVAEAEAALKKQWGEANYSAKVRNARAIADKLGVYEVLSKKGLASDPDIIFMLDKLSNLASEDRITGQAGGEPQKSPLQELEELKKSEAFLQKFHRDHKAAMARFMELNQLIANRGEARQPRY